MPYGKNAPYEDHTRLQPAGRVYSKFLDHLLASRRGQFALGPHADDFSIIGVSDDQSCFCWQQIDREPGINGPEKSVAPFQIPLPLGIRLVISAAGFAFDHPDFALGAQPTVID